MAAFGADQVHVRDEVVREVTGHMVSLYEER
jgi:hypothetical protein